MRSRQLRDNLHFITRHKFFDRLIQLFLRSSQIHCFFICLQLLPFLTLFLVVWIIKSGWRFLSWIDGAQISIPRVNMLWKVFWDSRLFCSTAALVLRSHLRICRVPNFDAVLCRWQSNRWVCLRQTNKNDRISRKKCNKVSWARIEPSNLVGTFYVSS